MHGASDRALSGNRSRPADRYGFGPYQDRLVVNVKLLLSGRLLFGLVSALVGLVVTVFIVGAYQVSRQELERDFAYEAGIYSETFLALQRTLQQELVQESRSLALDPAVQDILREGLSLLDAPENPGAEAQALRQSLYELVAPRLLSGQLGDHSRHLHFHLGAEDAISFLRLGSPERFGDLLGEARHLVADVLKQRKPHAGFEVGATFIGMRGVAPVLMETSAGQEVIGSVETGLTYDSVVRQIEKISGHDITVLLNRRFVERIMGDTGSQGRPVTPCGCLVNASSAPLPPVVLEYAQRNGRGVFKKTGEVQFMRDGDRTYVASFFPLRDYMGQRDAPRADIGSVVVWQDITRRLQEFESAEKKTLYLGVVSYLVIELLLLFGFRRVAPGLRMEIRTANEQLERNVGLRNFFEQTLDSVEESVFLISREGRFEYVNQSAVEQLGYDRARLLDMGLGDIDLRFSDDRWREQWFSLFNSGTQGYESVYRNQQGIEFPVEVTANHIRYQGDQFKLALVRDISARKQYERELSDSNTRYRSIIATARDGFLAVNMDGQILEVNSSYCEMLGYSRDELLSMQLNQLQDTIEHVKSLVDKGSDLFEGAHRCKNGVELPVEISASFSSLDEGQFFLFVRDISERKQDEGVSILRDTLSSMVHQSEMSEVLTTALDVAEDMTASEIAFYHFIDPGEQTLSLQAWSTRTLRHMCTASGDDKHYPVGEAGVWVDCVKQRAPVIYNDYPALSHRKGLPDGHAALTRLATVPVFRDKAIVAIMGVGNKADFYNDRDLEIVSRIADMVYDFARHSETKQHVEFMAYYDTLTGLPNRDLFYERLQQNIAQHSRSDNLMALCYLDLDGFKPINDDHGHSVGDELLIGLGQRLSATLREGDTLARIGGDEFLVMLTGLTASHEAEHIVQRLINETSKPFDIDGRRLYVTASIGVTLYPTDDTNPDTLLRHADQAMYKAKSQGKSRYSLYELVEEENQRARREIQQEVHRGLSNNEFVLWYQPRIDLNTGQTVGVEALVRWRHPRKGFLPPGAFLPYIEDTADEIALGEWVVEHALSTVAGWQASGLNLPVSINISPNHIQNADFASFLRRMLLRYPDGLAAMVELEILETAAIGDIEHVVAVMKECVDLGVGFSLDDFGTGYSSLTYFHRLPVHVLKIDQNFVRNMLKDAGALEIVKGVVQLAKTLKRPVVAEGVENHELGLMLIDMQCEYAQGYGIAKPMPAETLTSWLDGWALDDSWRQLTYLVRQYDCDMELKVAVYSYAHWCGRVLRYVESSGRTESPLLDENRCQFGRWQNGIGRMRYGDQEAFPFVAPRHALAHKLARDIVAYVDHGDMRSALALLVVFNSACSDLREKLQSLDRAKN
jgi:diguanylate cyclase (GGDEF)-like protein/PAS domain S-box-containing protein